MRVISSSDRLDPLDKINIEVKIHIEIEIHAFCEVIPMSREFVRVPPPIFDDQSKSNMELSAI